MGLPCKAEGQSSLWATGAPTREATPKRAAVPGEQWKVQQKHPEGSYGTGKVQISTQSVAALGGNQAATLLAALTEIPRKGQEGDTLSDYEQLRLWGRDRLDREGSRFFYNFLIWIFFKAFLVFGYLINVLKFTGLDPKTLVKE